jgi:Protein of unknown function (DUF3224)
MSNSRAFPSRSTTIRRNMTGHITRFAAAAAAVALVSSGAGGSFAGLSAASTAHRPQHTHKVDVHAHFTAPPDVLTIAPPCTLTDLIPATGVCRGTGFGEGTYTGDIQATSAYEYGFAVSPEGVTSFANLETFTGAITGCGEGTVTLRNVGTLDAAGHIDYTWQVVAGLGSGELADVTGKGIGSGTYNADATQTGEIIGRLRCKRT